MMDQTEKLIEETRNKIAPFIGDFSNAVLPQTFSSGFSDNLPTNRFIRKIPKQNYEDLPRLVPINWL